MRIPDISGSGREFFSDSGRDPENLSTQRYLIPIRVLFISGPDFRFGTKFLIGDPIFDRGLDSPLGTRFSIQNIIFLSVFALKLLSCDFAV